MLIVFSALYTAQSTCTISSTSSASHTTTAKTTKGYTTSTIYTTHVYTVTSCASTVTNCPAGEHVTTETVVVSTPVCPIEEEATTTAQSGYEEYAPTTTPGPSTSTQVKSDECGY